jgi:sigma-B regulation protein RsbU (phosphoserine phosphatase)
MISNNPSERSPGSAPLVLVVDDEQINVLVLKGMLQVAGFSILTAQDGPSGRELAHKSQPDIILLDIMMPGETGFETCRLLKQDPATTDVPVIFISALADVENKVRGLEIGAVDYITKPFEKAEVMARIRLHLKLKLAHRAVIEEQASKLRQISEAQKSILVNPEDFPDAKFAIQYVPILEAGGDFYDVFPTIRNCYCYFVGDISGHDLGASFVTSSLKALVRQNSGPLYTPLETMKNINSVLKSILRDGKYLTAQGVFLHRGFSQLVLLNAGHPPPLYLPVDGKACFLEGEGDILGAFENICIEPLTQHVSSGDRIFMYTDGLVERFGEQKRSSLAGAQKLLELCEAFRDEPIERAVESVVKNSFPDLRMQQDDIVLMGIEV